MNVSSEKRTFLVRVRSHTVLSLLPPFSPSITQVILHLHRLHQSSCLHPSTHLVSNVQARRLGGESCYCMSRFSLQLRTLRPLRNIAPGPTLVRLPVRVLVTSVPPATGDSCNRSLPSLLPHSHRRLDSPLLAADWALPPSPPAGLWIHNCLYCTVRSRTP